MITSVRERSTNLKGDRECCIKGDRECCRYHGWVHIYAEQG